MERQPQILWWRRLLGRRELIKSPALRPADGPEGDAPGPGTDVDDPDVRRPSEGTARDPGVDLAVASAVLTVASRLTSAELRRRLTEAVSLLPDITVIFPAAGEPFDPDLHTCKASAPASAAGTAETIAETWSAGLLDHRGTVRRRADVVVYDTTEDNR